MIIYFIALFLVPFAPLYSSWILFGALVLNFITTVQTVYLSIKKSPELDTAFKLFR